MNNCSSPLNYLMFKPSNLTVFLATLHIKLHYIMSENNSLRTNILKLSMSGRALMPLLARTLLSTLTSPMARSNSSTLTSLSSLTLMTTRRNVTLSSPSICGILQTTTKTRSRSLSVRMKSKKQSKTLSASKPNLPRHNLYVQARRLYASSCKYLLQETSDSALQFRSMHFGYCK